MLCFLVTLYMAGSHWVLVARLQAKALRRQPETILWRWGGNHLPVLVLCRGLYIKVPSAMIYALIMYLFR